MTSKEISDRNFISDQQQEPVGYWNGKETAWFEHELCGHPAPDGCNIPLYTTPPTAALAARQMRDAAAQKCIELMHKQTTHEAVEAICEVGKIIAALPVPEVQWRDLRDVEIGYIYDDVSRTVEQEPMLIRFAKAVIAKFKEKQL